MIVLRLAGLFFAFVQISLAARLILPFIEVPDALVQYVPVLLDITDLWIAPFEAVVERFELTGIAESLDPDPTTLVEGPTEFEPVVPLAMVFWIGITMFVMFVLRLIFRPQG